MKKKSKNKSEIIKNQLLEIFNNINQYETHEIILIRNTLENGIIESFMNGKISKEKMEHYLYEVLASE